MTTSPTPDAIPPGHSPPDKETDTPLLGPRFSDAFAYAAALHHKQVRKGSDVPYVSHLMTVAALVLEHGADEEVAIAALLHDAVEDQGGQTVLDTIRARFGDGVADIVYACSDSVAPKGVAKEPWRLRKERYLAHVATTSARARLVSIADKLHNCRATVADLHAEGPATLDKFNASRADIVWFYRAFCDAVKALQPSRLTDDLERVVADLERLAG